MEYMEKKKIRKAKFKLKQTKKIFVYHSVSYFFIFIYFIYLFKKRQQQRKKVKPTYTLI